MLDPVCRDRTELAVDLDLRPRRLVVLAGERIDLMQEELTSVATFGQLGPTAASRL
jgi:hypothetical protein